MDMLPLVPVLMLGAVGMWLLWPVIVDPLKIQMRSSRRNLNESADTLADGLFGVWREQSEKVGAAEPMARR